MSNFISLYNKLQTLSLPDKETEKGNDEQDAFKSIKTNNYVLQKF
jgi:hypothetical protein